MYWSRYEGNYLYIDHLSDITINLCLNTYEKDYDVFIRAIFLQVPPSIGHLEVQKL